MQKLQKRLNLLEMDIVGHQNQIDSLTSQVEAFEESGHFDSANIQERQLELVARYDRLQVRSYGNHSQCLLQALLLCDS